MIFDERAELERRRVSGGLGLVRRAPGLSAPAPDPRCTGFAVAGGHSRRMGRDKADLPWAGASLLDAAVERLAQVAAEVALLCGDGSRYGSRSEHRIPDRIPDAGALGGVYSGLCASGRPLGLFLAVDLPLVPVALLRHLLSVLGDADAVVPISPRGPEPLCAVYARSCREPIGRRLEGGERRMDSFWPDVRVRRVGPDELSRFGEPERLFANLNTPEEYERARLEAG